MPFFVNRRLWVPPFPKKTILFLGLLGILVPGGAKAGGPSGNLPSVAASPSGVLARQAADAVRKRDRESLKRLLAEAKTGGDPAVVGEMLLNDGFLSFLLGQNDAALASYREAGATFRRANLRPGAVQARLRETDVYLRRTELGTVAAVLDEVAGTVAELKEPILAGDYYRQLAYLAFIRGDHDRTVADAERALAAYRQAGSVTGLSQVERILGDLFGREGDFATSSAHYRRALDFGREGGEPIFIGRALWGLGTVDYRRNEFQRALTSYVEAREVFTRARYPVGVGDVSQWEGDIYRIMGNRERALESFRLSFENYSAAGSRVGMGSSLMSQGILHLQQHEPKRALELFERARALYGDASGTGAPDWVVGMAEVTYWKGAAQLETGDLHGALATLEQALGYCRTVGDRAIEADIFMREGEIRQHGGDVSAAREYFERAREGYDRLGAHDSLSLALFRLAGVDRREGKITGAAAHYEGAILEAEKLRARAGMEVLKRTLLAKVIDRYEEAALFMMGQEPERAFTLAEGMKARSFLDQLAESSVDVTAGINPTLKLQRDRLEAHRDLAAERLRRELRGKEPGAAVPRLKGELDDVDRQLEEIRRVIRLKNPLYSGIHYPEPVRVPELKGALHEDELLVEYFIGGGDVYRFLVGPALFRVEKLGITQRALEASVAEVLRGFVGEPGKGVREAPLLTASVAARLAELYRVLLGGMSDQTRGKRLILVPDGALVRLPFEMLVARRDPVTYAIQLHDIEYIQSATVLVTQRRNRGGAKREGGFIGFGDPVYDWDRFQAHQPERGSSLPSRGGSLSRAGYLRGGGGLTRLEGSGVEVTEIAEAFRRWHLVSVPLLRDKARVEAALGNALSGYSYIHFSTHGILESHFQALALTQDPSSPDDGFLTFGDIMNSRFSSARLVALSACETGLGPQERGEGVTGLTRAVMYAGSPAVLVSLWKVDDQQTRKLMIRFYQELLEKGVPPTAALREAKLSMAADEDELTASPFSWAAFVMYGD